MTEAANLRRLAALLTLVSACLLGCAVAVTDETVTTSESVRIMDRVRNDSTLSDDDKRLFLAAMERSGYIPYGKTVARIIAEEKATESRERAAAAERVRAEADVQRRLRDDLVLSLSALSVKRGVNGVGAYQFDDPYHDIDTLVFTAENHSDRAIRAFSAAVTVTTQGGGSIFDDVVSDDGPMPRGKQRAIRIAHEPVTYKSENTNARNTPVDRAVMRYAVKHIWYADGTEIAAPYGE